MPFGWMELSTYEPNSVVELGTNILLRSLKVGGSMSSRFERKVRVVEELVELMKKYPVIGVASLSKIRARDLQELRKILRPHMRLKCAKNTLFKIAARKAGLKNLEELEPFLKGENFFIFADMNPYKLNIMLEKTKVKTEAKPGDVASDDVVIPAGNTGLPPGPVISKLSSLGIPTRIESGSIWVVRDTVVVRKGEVISHDLADILKRLGVKSVEVGLSLRAAYEDGVVLSKEDLTIDLEEVRASVEEAYAHALAVSVEAGYVTPETVTPIILTAHTRCLNLAVQIAYPCPETLPHLLAKAEAEAMKLAEAVGEA